MDKNIFLKNSDDTGKFIVKSTVTRRSYFVEPIGDIRTDWGSYNPSTGNIENKKGWQKNRGSVDISESVITEDNGFKNIETLSVGESPMSYIYKKDLQYELEMSK